MRVEAHCMCPDIWKNPLKIIKILDRIDRINRTKYKDNKRRPLSHCVTALPEGEPLYK